MFEMTVYVTSDGEISASGKNAYNAFDNLIKTLEVKLGEDGLSSFINRKTVLSVAKTGDNGCSDRYVELFFERAWRFYTPSENHTFLRGLLNGYVEEELSRWGYTKN